FETVGTAVKNRAVKKAGDEENLPRGGFDSFCRLINTLSKPITPVKLDAIQESMKRALQESISIHQLFNAWDDAYTGQDSPAAHRLQFFSLVVEQIQNREQTQIAFRDLLPLIDSSFEATHIQRFAIHLANMLDECSSDSQIQRFCLQLFHPFRNSFSQWTCEQADLVLGRLAFTKDHSPQQLTKIDWNDFSQAQEQLKVSTTEAIEQVTAQFHPQLKEKQNVLRQEEELRFAENRYAVELAKLLIRPMGGLNASVLSDFEEHARSHTRATPFDAHIASIFKELRLNNRLQLLIDQTTFAKNAAVVEATIGCRADNVQKKDVQATLAAALLSTWRQRDYGSCVATSTLLETRDSSLEWTAQECRELLETGELKRTLKGREVAFLGSTHPAMHALFEPLAMQGSSSIQLLLDRHPTMYRACEMIGVSAQDIQMAVDTLRATEKPFSIYDILKQVTRSEEELEKVAFHAAGSFDMPLLRIWENSLSSMQCPPLTTAVTRQQKAFFSAISHTLQELSRKISSPETADLMKACLAFDPNDLKGDFWRPLEKIRFAVHPSEDPQSYEMRCIMYSYDGKEWVKIQSKEDFGQVLRTLFSELTRNRNDLLQSMSNAEIADCFLSSWLTFF
ncbi:MAG TPA: hypothetical protein VN457_03110, partial [Chlamydiales bacterium]|nr:hypothetical protein [Chlamydiales bacterium]